MAAGVPKVDEMSTTVLASVDVPKIRRIVDDGSSLGERMRLFGRWPVTELGDGAKRDGDGSGLVGSLLTVA